MVYRSVNITVCTSFSHCYCLVVYDYTPCFLPTVVEDGPVDVASMSGALVSGAHKNMSKRVVDDR